MKGKRVRPVSIDHGPKVEPGTLGTVTTVDNQGRLRVQWDSGLSRQVSGTVRSFGRFVVSTLDPARDQSEVVT